MTKLEEIQNLIAEYNEIESNILSLELRFVQRKRKRPVFEMNNIITAFCNIVGVSIKEVISGSRKQPLPDYRAMLAFYLNDAGFTHLEIAGAIGWTDHSTSLSAKNKHITHFTHDKKYRKIYENFVISLQNGNATQIS